MKPLAAALVLVAFAASACQSGPAASILGPPSGDIVIASDLPVTAFYSDAPSAERAIRLAIGQHSTIGRFKLAYWSLDDSVAGEYSPETAVQNVSWMIEVPRVLGMIGPFPSGIAAATIPVGNRGGLVMISPSNTRACLTQLGPLCPNKADRFHPSGRINYFRIAPPDPTQGLAMARYATHHMNISRVAVLNEDGGSGDPTIDSFVRELRRLGGDVVARQDFPAGTPDFQAFVQSARTLHAQAIYAMGATEGGICAVRAQMPADMTLLGTDEFADNADCLSQAADHANSIVATKPDVDITNSSDPAAATALHEFKKAYPHTPIVDYTFAAYDCAQLLIRAIEQAIKDADGNLPNRTQVLDAVARIQFTGVTGTYAFDANGDATAPLMEIYDVENGAWVNKGKIDATAAPS